MRTNVLLRVTVAWWVHVLVFSDASSTPLSLKTLMSPGRRLLAENSTARGCFYQGKQYEHGDAVLTPQPCLNCTCSKGVLLCYLRVCPLLSTPPPGCFSARREGECCPSVVCGNEKNHGRHSSQNQSQEEQSADPSLSTARPNVEDRSSVNATDNSLMVVSSTPVPIFDGDEDGDVDFSLNTIFGGCYLNGSLYAEGSAIMSGSFCEYCYCIRGKGVCTRPKCHLSIDNCSPHYSSEYACCPTSYVCSGKSRNKTTPSTTTSTSPPVTTTTTSSLVCDVDGVQYHPGEAIPNAGHCNHCYCSNQGVRCEKIECSPAMEGCVPLIPDGHCCPVEYNCNSTSISTDVVPANNIIQDENDTDSFVMGKNPDVYITDVPQMLGSYLSQESAKMKEIIEPEVTNSTSSSDNSTSQSQLEHETTSTVSHEDTSDPDWDQSATTQESSTQTEASETVPDLITEPELTTVSTMESQTTSSSVTKYPVFTSRNSFTFYDGTTMTSKLEPQTITSTALHFYKTTPAVIITKSKIPASSLPVSTTPNTQSPEELETRPMTLQPLPGSVEGLTTSQPTTMDVTATEKQTQTTTMATNTVSNQDETLESRENLGPSNKRNHAPFRENDRIIYFPEVAEALQEFINFRRRAPDASPSVSPVYKATTKNPETTKQPAIINFQSVYTGKPYFVDSFGNFQERVPVSNKDSYNVVNRNSPLPDGSHKYYRNPTEKPYRRVQGNSHYPFSLYKYGPVSSIYSNSKKDSIPGEKSSVPYVPGEIHYRMSDDMMQNDAPPDDTRSPMFAAESRGAIPDIIVGKIKEDIVIGKFKGGQTDETAVKSIDESGKTKDAHSITEEKIKSQIVVGKIKDDYKTKDGNSSEKGVEIITAPSAFDTSDDIDFGRSHLLGPDAKQSRSEPIMRVVSLKQVFQVSHDFSNETQKSAGPTVRENKNKQSISYVSFSEPTFQSFLPSSDPLVPASSRVNSEHVATHPPGDPKPVRVIPFLAEDALSKSQNRTATIAIFRKRPSSTTIGPQTRPPVLPDSCVVSGKTYHNGESIVKNDPCRLCRCFYGKELCHGQNCPDPPRDNCRAERMPGFCCPRYTCGEKTDEDSQFSPSASRPYKPQEDVTTEAASTSLQDNTQTAVHKQETNEWHSIFFKTERPAEAVTTASSTVSSAGPTAISTGSVVSAEPSKKPSTATSIEKIPVLSEHATPSGPDNNHVWGLLRVSGCNIYGKFYNLNEPVTELSGPCNSCVCSVHGVECNALC